MKVDSMVLDNCNMFRIISKTEPNFYCVFIQPYSVIDPENAISDLNLSCVNGDLDSENTLVEIIDDRAEAEKRRKDFQLKYNECFYVSCYKNGKTIYQ